MKDVIRMTAGQLDHEFMNRCTDTAKDFGIKANVHYEGMTFGWPLNTKHYRIVLDGEQISVEAFKKFMNDDEDDSIVAPLIFGGVIVVVLLVVFLINRF